MAKVHRATAADIDALVAMARDLHAEAPEYRDEPFDAAILRRRLADRLRPSLLVDHSAVFIAESDGRPVGALLAVIVPRDFNDTLIACETSLYVRPEHRGGRAFPRLVEAYVLWAGLQGAKKAYLGVSTGIHPERTVHAYKKLGGKLNGYNVCVDL